MVIEYGKLDTRYWRTKDPCVMLISYMELAIMGPLCILWYSAAIIVYSIKYHSSHERDFFQDAVPIWKFQLSFIHFFKFFVLTEPPTHPPSQEIPIPSVRGALIFSATAY